MSSAAPPTLTTDAQVDAFVKNTHAEVLDRHHEEKANALREALEESRDAVLASAVTPAPRHFSRRLCNSGEATTVSNMLLCRPCVRTGSTDVSVPEAVQPDEVVSGPSDTATTTLNNAGTLLPRVSVVFQSPKGQRWTTTRPAMPLEGAHEPRPVGTTPAFLKTHFATEDERALSYVPYFGDEDREDVVSELYDTEARERMVEFGPEYRERESHRVIEDTMQLLDEKLGGIIGTRGAVLQKRIEVALAKLLDMDPDLIHKRHEEKEPSTPASAKKPAPDTEYLGIVDSYRQCFCRRCFTYDCNMHGCQSKPDVNIQGELAIEKERSGFWKMVSA